MAQEGTDTREAPRPIEALSEQELCQDIITRINAALGGLPVGPVADGTGAFGYNRRRYEDSLICSYVRFLKSMGQGEEQKGVILELLGLFDGYSPQMQERDELPPADNRYYYIPLQQDQPAVVSVESFFDRAVRANPEAASRLLIPELFYSVKDERTGLPSSREADLQDFRDAVSIVRGYESFVRDIIDVTPHKFWGRPGLTE